jgi:hypothetical protein
MIGIFVECSINTELHYKKSSGKILQCICKAKKLTWSLIRNMVTSILLFILTLLLWGVWILRIPRHVPDTCMWSYIVEKALEGSHWVNIDATILCGTSKVYLACCMWRNLIQQIRVVDNISKALTAITNTQFSMRITTSQMVLSKLLKLCFILWS